MCTEAACPGGYRLARATRVGSPFLPYSMLHDVCAQGDTQEGRREQVVVGSSVMECRRDTAQGPTQSLDKTFWVPPLGPNPRLG